MFRHYEFWHPRIFETPYYLYLAMQCLANRIGIRTLAKANYALDHGEIGIGSKLATQMAFDQRFFLPTRLIKGALPITEKIQQLIAFATEHRYPVILKPDVGCVGKGICKLDSEADIRTRAHLISGDYIAQKFTPLEEEYGVFYIRYRDKPRITGINKKHFPEITGNGKDSLINLAMAHPRFSEHWNTFLQYFDHQHVPDSGETIRLSFIGSHTMGCKFTDETMLLTPDLEREVFRIFADQPGYNFGRIDIKTASPQALQDGYFTLIEVNGVASLPTHMFDPKYSITKAYRIFFEHAASLARIAREHRHQPMDLLPARQIIQKVRSNQQQLNQAHRQMMGRPP